MALFKNLRRAAAQMGYRYRKLDRKLLKLRRCTEETRQALDAVKQKKDGCRR